MTPDYDMVLRNKLSTSIRCTACCFMALVALVALTGCGKDEKIKTTKATTSPDVTPVQRAADQELEFFSEQYLSADERLRRRQARLQEALSGAPGAPASAELPAEPPADGPAASDAETTATP